MAIPVAKNNGLTDINSIDFDAIEGRVPIGVISAETGDMSFYMASRMVAWRFQTLFTKEPETITWISGFAPGGTMIDVGANVGVYSIWAAMHRNMRVFAFEPEAQNYAVLNKNIDLNNLDHQVVAYPCAVIDSSGLSVLNLGDQRIGGSLNSYGEEVDENLQPRQPLFRQGSVATTLDSLVGDGALPVPDHIKIDVDGFEHKVVAGARHVLAEAKVQSVMMELNNQIESHRELTHIMRGLGFDLPSEASARLKQKGGGNCLFRRTPHSG